MHRRQIRQISLRAAVAAMIAVAAVVAVISTALTGRPDALSSPQPVAATTGSTLLQTQIDCQTALGWPARTKTDRDFLTKCKHALEYRTAGPTPSPTTSSTTPSPTQTTSSPSATPSTTASPTATPTASPTATPSPTSSPAGPWPGPDNTGVPAGVTLTDYSGSCVITTDGAVFDSVRFGCDVAIRARGVIITRSLVLGQIGTPEESGYSYLLADSEVDAGLVQGAAVGSANITLRRVEVRGGATSVYCWAECDIRDSWLHGQRLPAGSDWHLGAFLANDNGAPYGSPDGATNAVLVHNTIHCEPAPDPVADGGCSGGVNLYGDFGPIRFVTIVGNLIKANAGISYCLYGGESPTKPYPHADHIVVTDNVFERGDTGRCGNYGPVSSFDVTQPGNVWSGNVWDTGGSVAAVN